MRKDSVLKAAASSQQPCSCHVFLPPSPGKRQITTPKNTFTLRVPSPLKWKRKYLTHFPSRRRGGTSHPHVRGVLIFVNGNFKFGGTVVHPFQNSQEPGLGIRSWTPKSRFTLREPWLRTNFGNIHSNSNPQQTAFQKITLPHPEESDAANTSRFSLMSLFSKSETHGIFHSASLQYYELDSLSLFPHGVTENVQVAYIRRTDQEALGDQAGRGTISRPPVSFHHVTHSPALHSLVIMRHAFCSIRATVCSSCCSQSYILEERTDHNDRVWFCSESVTTVAAHEERQALKTQHLHTCCDPLFFFLSVCVDATRRWRVHGCKYVSGLWSLSGQAWSWDKSTVLRMENSNMVWWIGLGTMFNEISGWHFILELL